MDNMKFETKSAFVAIVGCPNVGKSSLLNKMLGQKVAIVTQKPQTTRTKIMGVLTENDIQLVFTDTPGFHKPKTKLGEKMIKAVDDSIGGVDSCLFVTEAKGEIREAELDLLKKLKAERIPVVLAINKIDMLSDKQELMGRIVELTKLLDAEKDVKSDKFINGKFSCGMKILESSHISEALKNQIMRTIIERIVYVKSENTIQIWYR